VKVFNRYCLCVTEQTPSEPTGDQGHVIMMSHTLFLACQFGVTHDVNLNLVNCFIWINDEVKRFFTSAKFKFPPSRKFQDPKFLQSNQFTLCQNFFTFLLNFEFVPVAAFFEFGSKQVLDQLNQNPRYRAVGEDEPRRSTSVIGPVMTSPSSFTQMNDLKMDLQCLTRILSANKFYSSSRMSTKCQLFRKAPGVKVSNFRQILRIFFE